MVLLVVLFLLEVRMLVGLPCLRYLVDVVFVWGLSIERYVGFCEFFLLLCSFVWQILSTFVSAILITS